MTLTDYLEEQTASFGDRIGLIESDTGQAITYSELWNRVYHLADVLLEKGLRSEDRVLMVLQNSIAWAVSFLAIVKAGGIVVPLRQSTAPLEVKRLIKRLKPSLFIGDSSFINRSLPFDLLENRTEVVIRAKTFSNEFGSSGAKSRITRLQQVFDHVKSRSSARLLGMERPITGISSINITYRGYGFPLGAMLSHRNYIYGIKTYTETTGLNAGHRVLAPLPLSHVYSMIGCLLAPMAVGAPVVLVRVSTIPNMLKALEEHTPSIMTGVPTLYSSLLRSGTGALSSLGRFEDAFCGGSPLPRSLYEGVRAAWKISLRQGYGLTECLPITCNPKHANRPDTVGRVGLGVPDMVVNIFGNDGAEMRLGEIGEIAVKGPTVMAGYHSMPYETSEVLKDGWLYTGDYGWFDEDKYLHFAGLKKHIAKVAGNLVDLTEVERELSACPDVVHARVYATPDEKLGSVVSADVAYERSRSSLKLIRRHLKRRLASYKVPVMHEMPG